MTQVWRSPPQMAAASALHACSHRPRAILEVLALRHSVKMVFMAPDLACDSPSSLVESCEHMEVGTDLPLHDQFCSADEMSSDMWAPSKQTGPPTPS